MIFLTGLSLEVMEHFGNDAALSITWTIYATALTVAGFVRRSDALRWEGMALFIATTAKVCTVDLATLEISLRVLPCVVTGAVLMGISYLYQQRRSLQRKEKASA
jgi:uncharacterized membrane protein